MNIVDIAAGSDDFNLLVRALTAADLVDTVREADDITVFAPTDAAFTQLAQNFGYTGDPTDEDAVFDAIVAALTDLASDDNPIPILTNVLLYHVAGGARTQDTIEASVGIATLLDGAEIAPSGGALGDAEPDLADPMIVIPDIAADNGIIQAIDNVLLPINVPGNTSITDLVVQSGDGFDTTSTDFDILLAAVTAAGLAETLDAAGADLTVFAPNDAAFVGTAKALGFAGEDETGAFSYIVQALTLLSGGGDPIPLLTTILTYHVSPGAKDADTVLASSTIATLQGGDLTVSDTTLKDADPDLPDPTIIATDLVVSNGIVHVIDGVLFPVDILPSDGAGEVDFLVLDAPAEDLDLGPDNDFVLGTDADDQIEGGTGNDVIAAGGGQDTAVFSNSFGRYTITIDDGVMITDKGGFVGANTGTDMLSGVELLSFSDDASFVADGAIDLSVLEGGASLSPAEFEMLVELYVAYFNRAPDALGLLFWADALADGASMREIAEMFFDQPETQAKMPATLAAGDLVDLAYDHVLERAPDGEGRAFWVEALESGGITRAEFMLELLAGARADSGSPDDVRTIEDKTDIGVSYALINGLTNVSNAETALELYERENAESSLAEVKQQIDLFALEASGAADAPEAVIQIVGAIDDPFAVA
ncbi:MAG: fasciclin domain-containing protein [Pseudomonadota bacterium]